MTSSSPNITSKQHSVLPLLPPEKETGFVWKSGIHAVLDIGSTKTTCLIGRGLRNGHLQIIGWGWRRSEGINSGTIVDTARLEAVIRATVGDAEKHAKRRINEVTVNLSCGNPQSYHIDTGLILEGREVIPQDVRSLLSNARQQAAYDGRDIIHALPLGFNVDETAAVLNPCGHQCDRLLGKFHIIDANTSALRTLSTVLQRAELRLKGMVSSPFASGLSVLDHDERELGITVIEMGAGTTSLAIFSHGRILHTSQIRVGGHHITRDIATALSIDTSTAEWLKTMHGAAHQESDDEHRSIRLPLTHNRSVERISRAHLVAIIMPRIEETLEITRHYLDTAGLGRLAEGRIVLTGGASLLSGIGPVAARIFGRQIRLGHPQNIHGLPESAPISAGFATASGLLSWAAGAQNSFCIAEEKQPPEGLTKRLVNFIRKNV